jgi:hypothetical protein
VSGRTMKVLAAVAAAAVLAGCGGAPPRAGAAAIVGDERIETATLAQAVRDWQREFRADSQANGIRDRRAVRVLEPETTNALVQLVLMRVYDEAGRRAGLRVSEGQVDMGVNFLNSQYGSAASYARAAGLPGRYARDLARVEMTALLLQRRSGGDASRSLTLLRQSLRSLNIKINPRYGTFDQNRLVLGPSQFHLSRPESGVG